MKHFRQWQGLSFPLALCFCLLTEFRSQDTEIEGVPHLHFNAQIFTARKWEYNAWKQSCAEGKVQIPLKSVSALFLSPKCCLWVWFGFGFFLLKMDIAKGKLLAIFLCKKQSCKQFYGTENFASIFFTLSIQTQYLQIWFQILLHFPVLSCMTWIWSSVLSQKDILEKTILQSLQYSPDF